MSTTPVLLLRYPQSTDPASNGALNIQQLAEDVEKQMPRGFVDEKLGGGVTLAAIGTQYEASGSQIVVAAKPTQRRYRVRVNVRFNLAASATPGLMTARCLQNGAWIGRASSVYLTVAGGPGQQNTTAVATALVPANTAVTFSVGAVRSSNGAATDSVAECYIEVEDIGPN